MRPYVEQCISDSLRAQVHINKLTWRWSGLQPTLEIDHLTIIGSDRRRMLKVPTASATLSWRSLLHLAPVLSSLIVEQPEIFAERCTDGTYTIAGIRIDPRQHSNSAFLGWLMVQRNILLRGGILHWTNMPRDLPTLTFRGICAVINNQGLNHQFSLQAQPDGHLLRGPITLCAQFHHSPLKLLTELSGWSGTIFASSGNIALPRLTRYTDVCLDVQSGILDVVGWFNFASGEWRSARGVLSGSDLRLRIDQKLPQLDVPSIRLDWALCHNKISDLAYTLNLSNMRLELGGQAPLDDGTPITRVLGMSKFNGEFRRATLSRGQFIGISGDLLDVGLLAQLMRALPLPHRILHVLEQFDPRGKLVNYGIQVERRAPHSLEASSIDAIGDGDPITRYRINAVLEGASFSAKELLPGAKNIWGKINADQNGGYAMIDTTNAVITIPAVLDNPRLTFKRFMTETTWTTSSPLSSDFSGPALTVHISRLILDNKDLCASASGIYSNPGYGYGNLNIEAIFDRLSLSSLARYLPISVGKNIRAKLSHALIAGTAHNATISIHGALAQFPYMSNPQAGILKIVVPFRDGSFDPTLRATKRMSKSAPGIWPKFDGIDGLFWISRNMLRFDIKRAHYRQVILTQLTGHIDDLSTLHSDLSISGVASGPLDDMMNYVNHSLLAALSNHSFKILKAKGDATLMLRLEIPRYPNTSNIRVNGSLSLADNTVSFAPSNRPVVIPPITQIHGKVNFTEHDMIIQHMAGHFLGGNIYAKGWIHEDRVGSFNVSGHLCTNAVKAAVLPGPLATLLTRISGFAPYSIAIHTRKNELPNISATSDLSELALQLPAPFTKQAGVPMPFSLSLKPATSGKQSTTDISQLDARLGPINLIYLVRYSNNNRLTIMHGAIAVNQKAELSSKSETTIAGDLVNVDADAWRALLDSISSRTNSISTKLAAATPSLHPIADRVNPMLCFPDMASLFNLSDNISSIMPTCVNLHFNTLTLLNRCWENIVIHATKTPGVWMTNIISDQVSGHIAWHSRTSHNPYGRFDIRLEKLVIPNARKATLMNLELEEPAQNFPSIDLIANEFTIREHNLGKLKVNIRSIDENNTPVWQLNKLDVINLAAKLSVTTISRTTRHTRNHNYTNISGNSNLLSTMLNFRLDIADGGALLDRLGLPRILRGGSGALSGKVSWKGRLTHINYAKLDGNLLFRLVHGSIPKINPGAAKLLSILSLKSLARLAMLDLSEFSGEGLPFDKISATSTIRNGIAKINNFTLNGVSARLILQGNINLNRARQDLLVTIVPLLHVDTVALATAIVNPLLGLGTFIADLVLSEPISQSFARHYAVTGSWSHPRVEWLPKNGGKMKRFEAYPL
ncbi:YhdP family protein [Candidatus Vallotia lariciata]|uniref:YhdP family phospholipid transporter n=1 Tax=Candidatus Vallotia laricis TaxID=2018052 RepID=UPI001D01DB42|nr:AsmA-like C-terminal region-containing protein [Candidatus Vallotia lariciata]